MRTRLDHMLVARGLVGSRSRAADLVRRGEVTVDGRRAVKAGEMVGEHARIAVSAELATQVSRAAGKLDAGLSVFGLSPESRIALDLGASTGGFTQVLLERGAAKVYAVDVGHGQLAPALRADPRVVVREGTDARALSRALVPDPVEAIVADVSFISLKLVLPPALDLAARGCWLVALVKPQFELGPGAIGKRGVVRDAEKSADAAAPAIELLQSRGWRVLGVVASPLPGKQGNNEWLLGAVRDG